MLSVYFGPSASGLKVEGLGGFSVVGFGISRFRVSRFGVSLTSVLGFEFSGARV